MKKSRMKIPSLLFCFSILLWGCDDDSSFEAGSKNYLPLEVGNIWIFRSLNDNDYKNFKRVTGHVTLDDLVYAEIVSGRFDADVNTDDSTYDTTYYRVDDDGRVYFRRKNSAAEENRFSLHAVDGDTWTYTIENNYTVTISLSVVSLKLKNKNLRDCKAYSYDISQWVDEEHTTTLAKGIGFVQEYSNAWGWGQVLESATINGRKFNF
jgi:hypothetical protein